MINQKRRDKLALFVLSNLNQPIKSQKEPFSGLFATNLVKFIPMGGPTPIWKDRGAKQEYIIDSRNDFFKSIYITEINFRKGSFKRLAAIHVEAHGNTFIPECAIFNLTTAAFKNFCPPFAGKSIDRRVVGQLAMPTVASLFNSPFLETPPIYFSLSIKH